jgi:hypothetical protein
MKSIIQDLRTSSITIIVNLLDITMISNLLFKNHRKINNLNL